jgi:hypothetical protein
MNPCIEHQEECKPVETLKQCSLVPPGGEEFTSPDGFPALKFKDAEGDLTSIWVKDADSYYWMAHEMRIRSSGGPLMMGGFQTGRVYVCPRDRMNPDGGFHSPALAWLHHTWESIRKVKP